MNKIVHDIGLDVHKETIAVAIAPQDTPEVRHYGILGSTLDAVGKLLHKLSRKTPEPLNIAGRPKTNAPWPNVSAGAGGAKTAWNYDAWSGFRVARRTGPRLGQFHFSFVALEPLA